MCSDSYQDPAMILHPKDGALDSEETLNKNDIVLIFLLVS